MTAREGAAVAATLPLALIAIAAPLTAALLCVIQGRWLMAAAAVIATVSVGPKRRLPRPVATGLTVAVLVMRAVLGVRADDTVYLVLAVAVPAAAIGLLRFWTGPRLRGLGARAADSVR